ncbi:hypothetical protein ACFL27_26635 [candidate division CSSED10-310 bacterium]|uniref:Glycosyltransferase RgtA/B/C/D-like domain-containing protein n=1 Tax=candidate division CSSED10-310 bacterium TaxID=2855610 RepID=A0ABV6Z5R6_UNCC1
MNNLSRSIFGILCIVLISLSLTVDFKESISGFIGDLAVYLCMGQSFAHDFDCEYTRQDLIRICKDWGTGPSGVFLKKVGSHIYYAKPIIYPLFASPLVRFLDTNGFILFNCLLILTMIFMGYVYLRCYNPPELAFLFSLTFFIFQVGFVYSFTIVPEVFNMFLVTSSFFFWFFPLGEWKKIYGARWSRVEMIVGSPIRYWLSAVLLGLATFSKLTNAVLFVVFILDLIFTGKNCRTTEKTAFMTFFHRFRQITTVSIIFISTIMTFFAIQYYFTGELNPQGGYRKVFYHPDWPFWSKKNTFDNGGFEMSPEKTVTLAKDTGFLESIVAFIYQRAQYTNVRMFGTDIFYYIFGRVGGLLPFFPMTIVGIVVSLFERTRRQAIVFTAVITTVGLFLLVMPQNYVGGAAIGNRYFINTYPVFLFLFTTIRSARWLWFPWISGSLFLAPLILNPFQANYNIGNFTTSFPYTWLPLEQSLVANLPTNVDPRLNYVAFSTDPSDKIVPGSGQPEYRITFADHNTYGYEWAMEREGFWVRGEKKSQFIIRYQGKKFRLKVLIQNGSVENTIKLKVGWYRKESSSFKPGEIKEYNYTVLDPFPYFEHSLLKCSVLSKKGFMPKFLLNSPGDDMRYLGCFISITLDPIGPETG